MLILIVGAALPALIILKIFLKRDSLKKEPARLIVATFFLGILSIIPAVIMELGVSLFSGAIPPFFYSFFKAFLVAGLCEEAVKMWVVRGFSARRSSFDERTDGIVYSVTAGLGFAFYENILYGLGSTNPGVVLIMRGFTAVPLHALSSGIMGYYIGKSYFGNRTYFGKGLLFAVLIHGTYDFILFSPFVNNLLIVPLLLILYPVLFKLMKRARAEDRKLMF